MKKAYTYTIHLLFIVLAGAWLLHFVFPVYYAARSKEIKNNQRAIIAHQEHAFEIKQFSYADFEKYHEDGELSIDGDMYDIVHITYQKDSVVCSVLKDAEETELNKHLARHISTKRIRNNKQVVFWGPVMSQQSQRIQFIYYQPSLPEHNLIAARFIADVYIANIIQPPEPV